MRFLILLFLFVPLTSFAVITDFRKIIDSPRPAPKAERIDVQMDMRYRPDLESYLHHRPDRVYLDRTLPDSEPRFLLDVEQLRDCQKLLLSSYSKQAKPLLAIAKEVEAWKRLKGKKREAAEARIRQKLNFLPNHFIRYGEEEAYTYPGNGDEDLEVFLSQHALVLPWGAVRIHHEDKGFFIAHAWKPIWNDLIFSGPDFVPTSSAEDKEYKLRGIPTGRNLPDDLRMTGANCGPSALAAYLNLSTAEAIELLPIWKEKGWVPIKPMLAGLKQAGKEHVSIKLHSQTRSVTEAFGSHTHGLAFIQFTGPWDKSWSQSYAHTHWIVYDRGMIYDNNAIQDSGMAGAWITEEEWLKDVVPNKLMFSNGTGFYVKNVLVPLDAEPITEIRLADELAPLVWSGLRTTTVREGKRDYKPGPAFFITTSGERIPVFIEKVEYTNMKNLDENVLTDQEVESREQFLDALKRFYPKLKMTSDLTVVTYRRG